MAGPDDRMKIPEPSAIAESRSEPVENHRPLSGFSGPDGGNALLFCLREGNDEEKSAVLVQWGEDRWDELVRQSVQHSVSAYVYHRLKGLKPAAVIPADIERKLRYMTQRNASRNIRLYHHLGRMLETLSLEGVPVILLKGIHLAAGVYDDIALRYMDDADILVRKDDLHRMVTALFGQGFRVIEDRLTAYVNWSAGDRYHIPDDARHFFTLVHPDWPAALDVHCSLMESARPVRIESDGLWERSVRFRAEGIDALALSSVDTLVYQCLHASLHHLYEYGLRPFCDIRETLRHSRNAIDWDEARSRAEEWGVGRSLSLTLRLARDLMGIEVPDRILSDRPADAETVAWAANRIASSPLKTQSIPFSLVRFHKTRRFRELVSAVLKTVFISRKKLAIRHNQAPDTGLIFLYYPVHFMELFHRWGRMTWDIIFRGRDIAPDAEDEAKNEALEKWLTSGV